MSKIYFSWKRLRPPSVDLVQLILYIGQCIVLDNGSLILKTMTVDIKLMGNYRQNESVKGVKKIRQTQDRDHTPDANHQNILLHILRRTHP